MIHSVMKLLDENNNITIHHIKELSVKNYGESNTLVRTIESLVKSGKVTFDGEFYTKKDLV